MRRVVVLGGLIGCGRFGFHEPTDARDLDGPASSDGVPTGDGPAAIDAPVDVPVGPGTTRFGETPTSDVMGVTADTELSSEGGSTTTNYGASTSLECEGSQKHVLLRLDLSALAQGTVVTSAQLHLTFSNGSPGTITIRPVLEDWVEGTQAGSTGVANNVQRTATANWTTAGANAPGSAGAAIATMAGVTGANTIMLPTVTVQGWIDTPSTNRGVTVVCAGDTRLAPRESATATSRPQLDVMHQ